MYRSLVKELVFLNELVDLSIINAKSHGSVPFTDHDDIRTPRQHCRFDYIVHEHVLDVLVDHGQLCRRMPSQLFEMWGVVSGINAVRYDPHSTDVILRAREVVGPVSYKSYRTSSLLVGQVIWQPIK